MEQMAYFSEEPCAHTCVCVCVCLVSRQLQIRFCLCGVRAEQRLSWLGLTESEAPGYSIAGRDQKWSCTGGLLFLWPLFHLGLVSCFFSLSLGSHHSLHFNSNLGVKDFRISSSSSRLPSELQDANLRQPARTSLVQNATHSPASPIKFSWREGHYSSCDSRIRSQGSLWCLPCQFSLITLMLMLRLVPGVWSQLHYGLLALSNRTFCDGGKSYICTVQNGSH